MVKPLPLIVAAVIGLAGLMGGCASNQEAGPLTLSADKPTLLYFYTDG